MHPKGMKKPPHDVRERSRAVRQQAERIMAMSQRLFDYSDELAASTKDLIVERPDWQRYLHCVFRRSSQRRRDAKWKHE